MPPTHVSVTNIYSMFVDSSCEVTASWLCASCESSITRRTVLLGRSKAKTLYQKILCVRESRKADKTGKKYDNEANMIMKQIECLNA